MSAAADAEKVAATRGTASASAASPRVWLCAALGAVALHAGGVALALATIPSEDDSDALGASAIEIGVERIAPHGEPIDLPPGPDAEASAASPAVAARQAVDTPADLPKAAPTETDDPDRIVAPERRKPPRDEAQRAAAPTAASAGASAAVATAVPTSETAAESARSIAPAPGSADSTRRVRATWQKELAAHLDRYKRYPADRAEKAAEVVVRFALDRAGHVLSVAVVTGSGDASFDAAALAMMQRADPVPAPPPRVADDGLSFTLPVIFRARGRK